MSALGALRASLVAALATISDVQVYDHLPELIYAPALVIVPSSPYVTSEGQPFGHFTVGLTVIAVTDVSTNEYATAALDDLLGFAVAALLDAGLPVVEIGEPYAFQSNTALHLAADLAVTDSITF